MHDYCKVISIFTLSGKQRGIPRGIPNVLMTRDNRTKKFDILSLPSPDQAAQMYRASGGRITDPDSFGDDPIALDPDKIRIRDQCFSKKYNSFTVIFNELVNGEPQKFKHALLYYIDITRRLSAS